MIPLMGSRKGGLLELEGVGRVCSEYFLDQSTATGSFFSFSLIHAIVTFGLQVVHHKAIINVWLHAVATLCCLVHMRSAVETSRLVTIDDSTRVVKAFIAATSSIKVSLAISNAHACRG